MTWLYLLLVAVLCAAVPATVWLKRAGDQSWQQHEWRQLFSAVSQAATEVQVAVGQQFMPALADVGRELARMQREFELLDLRPLTEQIRRAVADIARVTRTRFDREGDA